MSANKVGQYLAKTFGEKAFGRETLIIEHPWTGDVFVFGELDTHKQARAQEQARAQAFVIDKTTGVVDDLGEICVSSNPYNANYVSLKDDFDISVSIADGQISNPHYSTMDGIPGPVMTLVKAGAPGISLPK